jgi:hypothetical protein
MFELPTDTAGDREASKYWANCGYAAIGFMAFVCYIGWWYQRYLRRRFMQRVGGLGPNRDRDLRRREALLNGMDGDGNENRNVIEMLSISRREIEGESITSGALVEGGSRSMNNG